MGKLRSSNPWTQFCKFPATIAHRILFWRQGNPRGATLGNLIYNLTSQVVEPYMRDTELFTESQANVLDDNVEFVAEMLDYCINTFGEKNVLIPETWPQPTLFKYIDEEFSRLF